MMKSFSRSITFAAIAGGVAAALLAAAAAAAVTPPQWITCFYDAAGNRVVMRFTPVEGATEYRILRRTPPGKDAALLAAIRDTQYADRAITPPSRYVYVVAAVTPGGEIRGEERTVSVSATTGAAPAPPLWMQALGQVVPTPDGARGQAMLRWRAGSVGTAAYRIYRRETEGEYPVLVASVDAGTTHFLDAEVKVGATYLYTVTALGTGFAESSPSETMSVAVIAPAAKKEALRAEERVGIGHAASAPSFYSADGGGTAPPSAPLPPSAPTTAGAGGASVSSPPSSPGVKAGWADDNKQFNYYLGYLERFRDLFALRTNVTGRVIVTVTDAGGRPVSGCRLTVRDGGGRNSVVRTTYADGRATVFTTELPWMKTQDLLVEASYKGLTVSAPFSHGGPGKVDLRFPVAREVPPRVPLDILFLLDATGSMGDEIARLKGTLEVITYQVGQLPSHPDLRLGMVAYRDRKDDFVTRVVPFTGDVAAFQATIKGIQASGGGDEPEDIQSALQEGIRKMDWREGAVKLVFLIGDAPPQIYPDQEYNYVRAMSEAAERGIKITTVGASGLPPQGEFIFRQIAFYTMGEFVFLTYGERGESEGGTTASVSHHTGANYEVRNLDAVIVRIVKREMSHFGDRPFDEEEFFETVADRSKVGEADAILGKLLDEGLGQLLDYATVRVDPSTPTALWPVAAEDEELRRDAEKLEDKLTVKLFALKAFRLVERKDLRQVLEEQGLSLTGAVDEGKTVQVGKLLGAKVVIVPRLVKGPEKLELFLKMLRVETGEVLSVTLMKMDDWLL